MTTAPLPDEPNAATEASVRLRTAMLLVGTGYLFLTLCDYREGLANLALRFLLKDHLHLTAIDLAAYFAVTKLAWYCKPFAGLLADWSSTQGKVEQSLTQISSAMTSASRTYADAEAAASRLFAAG